MSRILVADVDAQTRLGIKLLLEHKGYRVDEAASGDEALMKLGIRTFDLIFLELAMLAADGQIVMRQLSPRLLEYTHVVLMTDGTKAEDTMKAYAMGATYSLTKPVQVKRIRDITDYLIGDIPEDQKRHLSTRL